VTDVRRWIVPGRVNLIGEHLDYNGGAALPIAIDRATTVKVRVRDDDTVNVWTTQHGGDNASFDLTVTPGEVQGWAAYVAGTVWALGEAGHRLRGADLVVESDLPAGAGLSSSAALTCGVASALTDVAGLDLAAMDLALAAQRAENDFVGMPCGLMDQLAVLLGEEGRAVHVDASTEPPTTGLVPIDWGAHDLTLAVIATGAHHALADGEYASRRRECEAAAAELGLEHLAQAGPDAVVRLTDETLKRRARHVLTESARVRGAVTALARHEWTQLGAILTASHASLRDDFEVSCPELDEAVEAALGAGALGARMTGGGFGGSTIALLPPTRVDELRARVEARYQALGWRRPEVFVVSPGPGAHLLP